MEQADCSVCELQGSKHDIRIIALIGSVLSTGGIDSGDITTGPPHKVDFMGVDFHESPTRLRTFQSPRGVTVSTPPRSADAMHHHTRGGPEFTALYDFANGGMRPVIAAYQADRQFDPVFLCGGNHGVTRL